MTAILKMFLASYHHLVWIYNNPYPEPTRTKKSQFYMDTNQCLRCLIPNLNFALKLPIDLCTNFDRHFENVPNKPSAPTLDML